MKTTNPQTTIRRLTRALRIERKWVSALVRENLALSNDRDRWQLAAAVSPSPALPCPRIKLGMALLLLVPSLCFGQTTPKYSENLSDYFSPAADARVRQSAAQLAQSDKLVVNVNQVSGVLIVTPSSPALTERNYISLSIVRLKGQKPSLVLGAAHEASDWIFFDTATFRFGTNVVRLTDSSPSRSIVGHSVSEHANWAHDGKDEQSVIKAIAGKAEVLCHLGGGKYDEIAEITAQTQADFSNILLVYFALGGEKLSL